MWLMLLLLLLAIFFLYNFYNLLPVNHIFLKYLPSKNSKCRLFPRTQNKLVFLFDDVSKEHNACFHELIVEALPICWKEKETMSTRWNCLCYLLCYHCQNNQCRNALLTLNVRLNIPFRWRRVPRRL